MEFRLWGDDGDDDEEVRLLDSDDCGNQRSYSVVTKGVGEMLEEGLKTIKLLIYGAQAQVGTLSARNDKQDAHIAGLAKTKAESTLKAGPENRMLVDADFRNRESASRTGPKDNALELKRFKTLCVKEGVGPSCLKVADRYGKMIALGFSPSSGVQAPSRRPSRRSSSTATTAGSGIKSSRIPRAPASISSRTSSEALPEKTTPPRMMAYVVALDSAVEHAEAARLERGVLDVRTRTLGSGH